MSQPPNSPSDPAPVGSQDNPQALALPTPLISAQALHAALQARANDPSAIRVVDARWYLLEPLDPATEYRKAHLPGAVRADMEQDLAQKPGPGRHPLPSAERFVAAMRRLGISRHTFVVVYDDKGGTVAGRLWWLLRAFGHREVALLDGGLQAWVAAGFELSVDVPTPAPGNFEGHLDASCLVVRAEVEALVASGALKTGGPAAPLLIDSRAGERYRGEMEPVDPRAGHIPGAVNVPILSHLTGGKLQPPAVLRQRFEQAGVTGERQVIFYCGSGVNACLNLLAMELAGFSGGRIYAGSWSDWCAIEGLPLAVGAEP